MNSVSIAEAYYTAMSEKNGEGLGKYLHPDVQFKGPLSQLKGKEAVLESVKNFTSFFKKLTIRTKFGSGDQAMVVYDVDFPEPIGRFPSAALLTIREGLIREIELFFDGRPFVK